MTNHGRREARRPRAANMSRPYRRRVTGRLQGDPQDPVVTGTGFCAAVAVRGGHPQGSVGGEGDRPDPPVSTGEVLPRLPGVGAVQYDGPDALALERTEPGTTRRDRDAARRALVDGPLG